jgi:hypothetical protein
MTMTSAERQRRYTLKHPDKAAESTRLHKRRVRATEDGREDNIKQAALWRMKNPRLVLVKVAKVRAKKHGREFSITEADIMWPTHCPVLGVELKYGGGLGQRRDVASLDRLDNTKGYVPGNVFVLSWRANCIKNDATAEELRAVATWIEKQSFNP